MISKGYVLVCVTGEYEDRREKYLVFSENKYELQEIESNFNSNQYELRERMRDTQDFKDIYFEFFKKFIKNQNILNYPTKDQFDLFINNFPIPEELEELVFKKSDFDENGKEYFYLDELTYEDTKSYYSVRELEGLNSNE